jgi:hypothetical protein
MFGFPVNQVSNGTLSATGTEVLYGTHPPDVGIMSGTLSVTGTEELYGVCVVSGQGSQSTVATKIAYAQSSLSGSGSQSSSSMAIRYSSSLMSSSGSLSATGYKISIGNASVLGSASISAIRTINFISAFTGRARLDAMKPYLHLLKIDDVQLTEQNRKFGVSETKGKVASVMRSDGTTRKFYPVDHSKKSFNIKWTFIGNDEQGNFDSRKGRDFLKSIADDGNEHTLSVRNPQDFSPSEVYNVVVKSYKENLKRRAVVKGTVGGSDTDDAEIGRPLNENSLYGTYFWDVSLELQEV